MYANKIDTSKYIFRLGSVKETPFFRTPVAWKVNFYLYRLIYIYQDRLRESTKVTPCR